MKTKNQFSGKLIFLGIEEKNNERISSKKISTIAHLFLKFAVHIRKGGS
jgi:hypothetical protein